MKATARSLRRVVAMLMLPLSIAPVFLLGPSVLRAPMTLAREIEGSLRQIDPFAVATAQAAEEPGPLSFSPVLPLVSASTATLTPSACSARAPRRLTLRRMRGPRVRLRWEAPSGPAPLAYRVLRSGLVVGQTSHTSMIVKVRLGRRATFAVQARFATAPRSCLSATLRRTLALRGPGRISKLRILARASTGVRIGWHAASAGDAPLAGYRVKRDGSVVAQTRSRSYLLRINTAHAHRISVAAVDTSGRLGPASSIGLRATSLAGSPGAAPSAPEGLSVSEVSDAGATVYWLPSTGGSKIVGYRVYRDGAAVGQTNQTTMRLGHLSSLHTYSIAVSALDSAKRESARSVPLRVTTSHIPPIGPTQLAALKVTDDSATLSWNAGQANTGRLVGYVLFQDGKAKREVKAQTATVALASERHYNFTVRTLDSAGYLSAPAPNLEVFTTHTPPPAPTGLAAGEITASSARVSWTPSTAVSGRIVGYRVFRDDVPVGQASGAEMTLTSLAPSTTYKITVTAVDSLGAISPQTAPLPVTTEDPVPTHGHAQAFLLASTDQSFHDLEAHYQQIGVVYPTYFDCDVNGGVRGKDDPLVTGWALARQLQVMPRLNCQNPKDENEILNEPGPREAMINQLAELGRTHGYSGFQIDFEGAQPAERAPFTAFITALTERLHSQGEKISTVVTAKYYNVQTGRAAMYDDAALSGVSDYLFVLDWGLHWTTSAPGGMDEYNWFKRVAEYTATMPNREKFVLGMPMYGIDWPNGGGASNPGTPLEFENVMTLATMVGATPEWEPVSEDPHFSYTDASGVSHSVWYSDQQSIAVRVALAESLGLGVGLWHLGSEDQSIWSLPGLA